MKYTGSCVRYSLKRTKFQCNHCGSPDVTSEPPGQRLVHGEPMGCCHEVIFEFISYRLHWPRCKTRAVDHIPFLSHPWSRMTKALERTVLELRQHMSIRAAAHYFHLRRHTVKELEKKHLKKKFHCIPTAHIKAIGIDMFRSLASAQSASRRLTETFFLQSHEVLQQPLACTSLCSAQAGSFMENSQRETCTGHPAPFSPDTAGHGMNELFTGISTPFPQVIPSAERRKTIMLK